MQKLADDAEIDVRNMCVGYDGMRCERQAELSDDERRKLSAWLAGRTGYPLVDACMRALHASGWINFRMRCMLVSFAAYDLWLSWKVFSPALAQLFIDYEPGIHYPQIQMQSGTTGINSNRIYDPSKQVSDHDPQGVFIKRYVPELQNVDVSLFTKPAKISVSTYPHPVVNHAEAVREARKKLNDFNRIVKQETRESKAVFDKHGSRRPNAGDLAQHNRHGPAEPVPAQTQEPPDTQSNGAFKIGLLQVEPARTGRSSCRACGQAIRKGDTRCGMESKYRGRYEQRWCHAICMLRSGTRAVIYKIMRGGKCNATGRPFEKGEVVIRFRVGDAETSFSLASAALCVQHISKAVGSQQLQEATEAWRSEDDGQGFVQLPAEKRRNVCSLLLGLGQPAADSFANLKAAAPLGHDDVGLQTGSNFIFQATSPQHGDPQFSAAAEVGASISISSRPPLSTSEEPAPKRFRRLRMAHQAFAIKSDVCGEIDLG